MMLVRLAEDRRRAPNAFDWHGPTERESIVRWLLARRRAVPDELVELWALTGGGDMFETEEVFAPFASGGNDLATINGRLWAAGLPTNLLVFHSGLYLTAVNAEASIIRVDPDRLEPDGHFASLDCWYSDLRREYGDAYGLPPASAT